MQKELSSIKNIALDQDVTLEKGKELLSGIYEANFKLNKAINIATLPKIGYHMLNGELVVRNHITEEEVKIPRDFHYLKVVKSDHDDYKLTFCNFLYQFSLLVSQIGEIAELFNCGAGKRSNKFAQSTLKQSNCIVYFIAQNVLFYI